MEPITYNINNDRLTLSFHGRIDTASAPAAGEIIDRALGECSASDVVMDFSNLEYISSAGLRLLLKVRKLRPAARITGVSPDVFDILEMTGFSEMIPVVRAFRKVSTDNCRLLAKGANGAVYRLNQDTILKVSLNPDALNEINRERELSRKAFILGVPTAISYDVVQVGDRYGAVYELLDCEPLSKLLADDQENLDKYVKMFVELLKTIHSVKAEPGEMPNEKAEVLGWVDFLKDHLPEATHRKLRKLVEDVPEDSHLLHGDYHARNIMVQNGEPLLIDMDTLSQGNPVFEFASVFNAYKGFSALDQSVVQEFQGISQETAGKFLRKIFSLYFKTDDPERLQEIEDRSALIGYARLLRRSIRREDPSLEKTRKAQEFYRNEICRLTEKLDSLVL